MRKSFAFTEQNMCPQRNLFIAFTVSKGRRNKIDNLWYITMQTLQRLHGFKVQNVLEKQRRQTFCKHS